jgi:predicted nucleic acid-binding protein
MGLVVLDASIVVPLVVSHPLTPVAENCLRYWKQEYYRLTAPCFMPVEVASALRQAVYSGKMESRQALEALEIVMSLGIELVMPGFETLQASLRWAERLGQSKAYDAQYVALAESLNADLWSADRRLVNALQALGAIWAHWIGEMSSRDD